MTDLPEILPRGDSPEYVAYMLLCHIALAEEKRIGPQSAGLSARAKYADRKWLLDSYAECLLTIRNPRDRTSALKSAAA